MAGKKGQGKGIPKTDQQKQKMSAAHSGKQKSVEHKLALSASQQERWDKIHNIMDTQGIDYATAKLLYAIDKNSL